MVRGCQRKAIFLKNTGSDLFSEAYFIVDEKKSCHNLTKGDMIKEANRIIDENLALSGEKGWGRDKFSRTIGFIVRQLPAFLTGAALATLVCILML
jgi:hypothetical protein